MTSSGATSASGLVPVLRYRDAAAAADWLCAAFGFTPHCSVAEEDGRIVYAQLQCGSNLVMLVPVGQSALDAIMCQPSDAAGLETQACYVVVSDAEAHHARAVAAGAEVVLALSSEGAGRTGYTARDPEGHVWSFGTYDPANAGAPAMEQEQAKKPQPALDAEDAAALSSAIVPASNRSRPQEVEAGDGTHVARRALMATAAALVAIAIGTAFYAANLGGFGPMAAPTQAAGAGRAFETAVPEQADSSTSTTIERFHLEEALKSLNEELAEERAARERAQEAVAAAARLQAAAEAQRLESEAAARKMENELRAQIEAERGARTTAEEANSALSKELLEAEDEIEVLAGASRAGAAGSAQARAGKAASDGAAQAAKVEQPAAQALQTVTGSEVETAAVARAANSGETGEQEQGLGQQKTQAGAAASASGGENASALQNAGAAGAAKPAEGEALPQTATSTAKKSKARSQAGLSSSKKTIKQVPEQPWPYSAW